jgi:hypothetical protein
MIPTAISQSNSIKSFKKAKSHSGKSECEYFWTQNKSTWAFEMQHLYQDEDPFFLIYKMIPFHFLVLIQLSAVLILIKIDLLKQIN